jgi:hypothetical protein
MWELSEVDLNYLYQRHQISVFMSENAACERSRNAHRGLMDAYASLITSARRGRLAVLAQ